MSQPQALIDPLTTKEREVMELYSNPFLEKAEIMERLSISMHTLNHHIASAFDKLGEADRFAASWKFWRAYPDCKSKVEDDIEKAIREAA